MPWELDKPWEQPYYMFTEENRWKQNHPAPRPSKNGVVSRLALRSWNIDFMLPYADSRMGKALSHLQELVGTGSEQETTATVIHLQECVESDITLIASLPWIRETFSVTDLDISNWQSGHYGTISLIDRRLPIKSCFRVHYSKTRMQRDGLFVDVELNGKTIRLCNSHLESLAFEPAYRPPQMKLCAEYMHDASVHGAIAAGDFNAIQAFDRTLHSENDLSDAFLELGGDEDDVSGHTWGQQASTMLRKQFGTCRMDKVFFCGGLELLSFEKFGADVCVEDAGQKQDIVNLGFDQPWITDHLGITAVFKVSSSHGSTHIS